MLDWLRSLFASSVRVYIYLPLTYNPDPQGVRLPIPDEEYYRVLAELEAYLIDLELTGADRQWFRQMKEVWRQRFEQEELYVQVLKRERL